MAVYDRVDKKRRRAINASKEYKQMLIIGWRTKGIPKTFLIKMMVEKFINDIKLWWTIRRLKKSGYYDRD
ncbi:hypothetical protein ES708_28962 [subsurface metagenome]